MDRAALSAHVLGPGKEENMKLLERSVHPLVTAARAEFLQKVSAGCRTFLLVYCWL